MIPNSIRHIYYRGFLKSCNYSCSYCPFAKLPVSKNELENDQNALNRFISWAEEQANLRSIMFVPYGEALVHTYYTKALAALSKMPHIKVLSCQTNLSLNPQTFIRNLNEEKADLSKVNLWATFHDEMEGKERFVEKVSHLNQHIGVCVGVVGTPKTVNTLEELKNALPKTTYLWVNAMEGLNRKYTPKERQIIESVDPQFWAELANPKAAITQCCAGRESVFVSAEGRVSACNRSKQSLGNIYTPEGLAEPACRARACDCFLAYVHRTEMKSLNLFGSGRYIRTPKGINISTIFFDVDGTLTNDAGVIEKSTVDAIAQLSKNHCIYLATALPYAHAMRKCGTIQPYLSGGVFANGADIRCFDIKHRHIVPMQPIEDGAIKGVKTLCYTHKDTLYKVTFTGKPEQVNLLCNRLIQTQGEQYHIVLEDGVISVTGSAATKLSGVLHLCNRLGIAHENVMVVGNGENDIEMLGYFNHSVAVPMTTSNVKNHATYTMSIESLCLFL